jgi:hypothetical protein
VEPTYDEHDKVPVRRRSAAQLKTQQNRGNSMSLIGHGFLCIWHNIAAGRERDFEQWHTVEHMPERVGVPGFNRGRRYANFESKDRTCFTLYEGLHLEIFRSPGYMARLNAPTPLAKEFQPLHSDFVRGVCENIFSFGRGIGGAVITTRVVLTPGSEVAFGDNARAAVGRALSWIGVNGIHVGLCRPDFTQNVQTKETELRNLQTSAPEAKSKTAEAAFGAVLILEGIGLAHVRPYIGMIEEMAVSIGGLSPQSEVYGLNYLLTPNA